MTITETTLKYYSDLLIIQYLGKPKFTEFIQECVRQLIPVNEDTGNLLLNDIQNGFNIDDAVGAQLDILGKYVGFGRTYVDISFIAGNYFGFIEYIQGDIPDDVRGFSDYTDFETKEGETLDYSKVITGAIPLSDFDYRTLLKLKIVTNNKDASTKTIDDALFLFFELNLFFEKVGPMTIFYFYDVSLSNIVKFAFERDLLPRPAGVLIGGTIPAVDGGYFGLPTYDDTILGSFNGFTDYTDFETKEGQTLNYERLAI